MADEQQRQQGRIGQEATRAQSLAGLDRNTSVDVKTNPSDDLHQSDSAEANPIGRPGGITELPAAREALLGTARWGSPNLQALYQAAGTSVDELLEQKKAIDCLASASLINAGMQRQKKADHGATKKLNKSKEEEGALEAGMEDSGSEKPSQSGRESKSDTTWTEEEDKLLYELVARFGTSKWSLVASKFENKTNKHCRRRWQTCSNVLGAKGAWTAEEDNQLIEGHAFFGNRWTDIAKLVPGRTDNAAKNRYFALLRKQQASAQAPKKADEEGGAGPSAGSKLHDFGLEGHSVSQREHPSESSELAGQKRSRPSGELGPHEELERTSVLPQISCKDRLQGGSSLDKPSRELPHETGRAALVTGRAARAFPEDLNLNLPGDDFPQQQESPPPRREYEFWPRTKNLQQEYGARDRLQEQDLGYLVPQDRHPKEQELGSVVQQELASETLDGGGGDGRSDQDTGGRDTGRTRPSDLKKESLDLDLNSAPLKWL